MKIGTANSAPGAIARGHVELAQYPDGPVLSPVMIARGGAGDGPRLYIQCLVHGPEIGAPIAVARFMREIDLASLKGTIVALLAANPLGMRNYNRLTPMDGMNLNRAFPGKPDGSVTEQLAHRLTTLAGENGDVLLDLHSGGDLTITAFYAIYAKLDSAASRESQRLVASTGSRYQWGSSESWLKGAAFGNFTRRFERPALIVETGGGARVTEQDLANYRTALYGIARALEMLPGAPPGASDIRYGGNAFHVKATRGGFWHPDVAPGDDMVLGQVMGRVVDFFGETVETARCPIARAWVGSIRRPFMPLYSGDQIVEVVESVGAP